MKSFAVRLSVLVFSLVIFPAVPALTQDKQDSPKRVAVRAGRLIDGKGKDPIVNAVILVENDRITGVGSDVAIPSDAEVDRPGRRDGPAGAD